MNQIVLSLFLKYKFKLFKKMIQLTDLKILWKLQIAERKWRNESWIIFVNCNIYLMVLFMEERNSLDLKRGWIII